MIRKAFMMSIYDGAEAEYERRHKMISPEFARVLKAHGVSNYSIFLNYQTRQLFAYAEIDDETTWSAIAGTPECRQWWGQMAELMPHNGDGSPQSTDLREVFHLS